MAGLVGYADITFEPGWDYFEDPDEETYEDPASTLPGEVLIVSGLANVIGGIAVIAGPGRRR